MWTYSHPKVLEHLAHPRVADVAQAYTLAAAVIAQAANLFVIGPITSQCVHTHAKVPLNYTETKLGQCSNATNLKSLRASRITKLGYGHQTLLLNFISCVFVSQVSEEMKALNKRFGALHGISSLLNLGAVLALGFHGLWIGNYGV